MIDTHTHLYLEAFDTDRQEAVERAIKAGVQLMLLPNIDSSTTASMMKMAARNPDHCKAMMGLYPGSVKENFEQELRHVEEMLQKHSNSFCAIGEIGLDYYWDTTFKEQQKEALTIQLEWALQYHLPVVLHTRDSFDDLMDIVESYLDRGLSGVFHCFSGHLEQAQKIIGYKNFLMGIGGVLTFKNSGLDNIMAHVGLEHLVLETDSPYLTPAPYRGKRNESSYLPLIAQKLADVKSCTKNELIQQTTKNALKMFRKIS